MRSDDREPGAVGPRAYDHGLRRHAALLLSSISSALGSGVSATRFEILLDETDLDSGSSPEECIEYVWKKRFPRGQVSSVSVSELVDVRIPAILLSSKGNLLLIRSVRGGELRVSVHGEEERPLTEEESACLALTFETGEPRPHEQDPGVPDIHSGDWFRAAFKAHGPLYRDVVLASLLVSVLGLVSAIYTMQVYDRVVPTGAFSTLFVLTVGVLISVALEAVGRQLKTLLIQRSSDRIDQHLSQLFFRRALALRMDRGLVP